MQFTTAPKRTPAVVEPNGEAEEPVEAEANVEAEVQYRRRRVVDIK